MNKICTSIEQSKKLIELGLDANTADMFWDTAEPNKRMKPIVGSISDYYDMEDWAIPAWSLSALLELMSNYRFESYADGTHFVNYESFGLSLINHRTEGKEPIDAAFEMVCSLKENKKI